MILRFTSLQAPNQDAAGQVLSQYVGRELDLTAEFVANPAWPEREAALDSGAVQVGWICGLPYIWKADRPDPLVELLAAPVYPGRRYGNQPIYFSDVIVRADSTFESFADLRGVSWAYNEPHSHSGYNVSRYHLASLGETGDYFGRVVEAGTHQTALQMVLSGRIDASAIDSTVLENEMAAQPELHDQLRILTILGPSPGPPWVVSTRVPAQLRAQIRSAMLAMEQSEAGLAALEQMGLRRFAAVVDRDYDAIREMERMAQWLAPWPWDEGLG